MKRVKKTIFISSLILVSLFLILVLGFWWLVSPMNAGESKTTSITVTKGASVTAIANQLESAGVIRSGFVLRLMLRGKDAGAVIQTGTFEFSPAMSLSQVADTLISGPKDEWITFLEGWRKEEMADELEHVFGIKYFHKDEFLSLTKDKEGMLFPDTYLFPRQVTANMVVEAMEANFEKKYQKLVTQYGAGVLNPKATLVLASILTREARKLPDMQMVAGILLNRIELGMPLQSDVTAQYFRGYDAKQKTWWPTPTANDKYLDTPFNTYKNKGLPPSPICNPGADAIAAALSPTKSDYIFYIADNQGIMRYAKTLAEHNANVEKYLK